MTAFEPTDRGALRGDGPLERYVRQLLRDGDRMRRSTQPRTQADRGGRVERPLVKPLPRPPEGPATDQHPPSLG